MTKTTRHIGFCPCCGGDFKVREDKLVHHGYKRPGFGFIVGDCHGALRTPHELSDELAREYLGMCEQWRDGRQAALDTVEALTEITVEHGKYVGRGKYEPVTYVKGECPDYEWRRVHESRKRMIEAELRAAKSEVARLTELVETWELKALTSVEEEQAQKQAAKAEREAAKEAKRQDKLATAIAKYQGRIDSAVKNRNSSTLADIWESIQRKLRDIDSRLSKDEALSLVERDDVWEAFGLGGLTMSRWDATEKSEREALRRMKDRMNRVKDESHMRLAGDKSDWARERLAEMSLEWPASLGGENKKGAKTLAQIKAIQAGENPWKVK